MTPPGKIPLQDWMTTRPTRRVIEALSADGGDVRFVGGCVRDALAGRPVTDIDLATHTPPEEVIRLLEQAGIKAVPTGIEHGTITAVADHKPYEVTTLRVDVETFGRHARVAFTDDWAADAARRDFTFNALSCAPDGTLFDPFGGVADLRAGRVRFGGDPRARIEEDYLRLLRFCRFQAHDGKTPPDPDALAVCSELAPKLDYLSGERLRQELFKLLGAEDPAPVIGMMIEAGVLRHVLPATGDIGVLRALLRAEPADEPLDPVVRLGALIEPDGKTAGRVADRLKLSNTDRHALVNLAAPEAHLDPALHPRVRWAAVHALGPPLYRKLLRLDWARHHAEDQKVPEAALERALDEAEGLAAKTFPLRGRDVLQLGIPSGPELGRLLDTVETWWAEQGFQATREDCLDKIRSLTSTRPDRRSGP